MVAQRVQFGESEDEAWSEDESVSRNMCVQRCAARHLVDQFSLFLYGWELATVA